MSQGYDIVYFPLGAAAFGGAERSILELASAQQAAGKRVLVCHEPALLGTDFMAQADTLGVPLRCIGWAPEQGLRRVLAAAWALFGELRGVPLVHFNISWRPWMWAVPWVARLRSAAKLVGSMRAMPERYEDTPRKRYFGFIPGLQLWKLPDLLVGRVWARALHATVSVNRDDYPPRLREEFGFPAQRLSVIYNGVRLPAQAPTPAEKLAAKRRLGYADGDFLVAYVGRVSPEKGLRFMVDALPACAPAVKLVIAGDGDEVPAIQERAQRAGVAGRVQLLGFVRQPFDVFTAAEVCVVPSLWNEAFGRVVVEAMACRAAVVATAVGGMQELFEHGREGYFVPKEDAAALAEAINRLAADPELLHRMQGLGRELVEARYTTQRVASEYGALYARLLGA